MPTPLVSITSAAYNVGPGLLDMVRSVFAQTFSDWELVIVDDGSTDDTYAIAQSIDDQRVRVFTNGRNLGRSASLNRLGTLARGKYVARMDADDMCSVSRIQRQVELLESDPALDVVGCGICYLDKNDVPLGHAPAPATHAQICSSPHRTFGIAHGSILGKRTWFEQNHYDESLRLAIDFNLFLRTYQHSTFANVSDPLYYYRLDGSFNLKKQFTARDTSARFLWRHSWNSGKPGTALWNWGIQYAKFAATMLSFATGLRGRVMARRFERLSDAEMTQYQDELNAIKSVDLPLR